MKKTIKLIEHTTLILLLIITITSCNNDSEDKEEPKDDNSMLIGSWQRNQHWGSIDGTETFTFSSNWTYSVTLVRIEDFNGPCSLDPYCDNDYSGEYWFSGNSLYYNSSYHGWTDNFYSWSVEGNILRLNGKSYVKQ